MRNILTIIFYPVDLFRFLCAFTLFKNRKIENSKKYFNIDYINIIQFSDIKRQSQN